MTERDPEPIKEGEIPPAGLLIIMASLKEYAEDDDSPEGRAARFRKLMTGSRFRGTAIDWEKLKREREEKRIDRLARLVHEFQAAEIIDLVRRGRIHPKFISEIQESWLGKYETLRESRVEYYRIFAKRILLTLEEVR